MRFTLDAFISCKRARTDKIKHIPEKKNNTFKAKIIEVNKIAGNRLYFFLVESYYLRSRLGMLLPEKYESIFDVSSEGPSSGSLVSLVY